MNIKKVQLQAPKHDKQHEKVLCRLKAPSHCAIFRASCLAMPLWHETLQCDIPCNDFKPSSASLRSHTSPLPSANACAMFRATCFSMRCETSCTQNCSATALLASARCMLLPPAGFLALKIILADR